MTGTVSTWAQLLADFPIGGPAGGITPVDVQNFIVTQQALLRGALTPEMYGAVGNGSTDDSTAFNNMFSAASSSGLPVIMSGKEYYVNAPLTFTYPTLLLGSNFSDGAPYGTTIIAGPALTGTVLTSHNISDCVMQNFCIDCNGNAATAIDTSWTTSSGPSLNIIFNYIQYRNFTTTGWIALNNNDCSFNHIVYDSPSFPNAVGMQINALGGNVNFVDCNFNTCVTELNCQDGSFINCVLNGVRFPSTSTNSHTNFHGGYIYTPASGITINFLSGSQVTSLGFFGTHMETNTNWNSGTGEGALFGGPGTLTAGVVMDQIDINITVSGGTAPKLVSTALVCGYGSSNPGRFIVTGGEESNNPLDWTGTSSFEVTMQNVLRIATGFPMPDTHLEPTIVFVTSPSSGSTNTFNYGQNALYLENTSSLSTQTFKLPPIPTGTPAGQRIWVCSLGGVTTATFQNSAGSTLTNTFTSLAAKTKHEWVCDGTNWWPVQ
jgi:hypothetical protein